MVRAVMVKRGVLLYELMDSRARTLAQSDDSTAKTYYGPAFAEP